MGGFSPGVRSALANGWTANGGIGCAGSDAGSFAGGSVIASVWQTWHSVQVSQWSSGDAASAPA